MNRFLPRYSYFDLFQPGFSQACEYTPISSSSSSQNSEKLQIPEPIPDPEELSQPLLAILRNSSHVQEIRRDRFYLGEEDFYRSQVVKEETDKTYDLDKFLKGVGSDYVILFELKKEGWMVRLEYGDVMVVNGDYLTEGKKETTMRLDKNILTFREGIIEFEI